MAGNPPGSRYATRTVRLLAPELARRHPTGIPVDAAGFPVWADHARAVVRLPGPLPGSTREEIRVVDVLAANQVMAKSGDPLWTSGDPVATPPGWTWAHVARTRDLALVPTDLHAAIRHAGGISTLDVRHAERGLRIDHDPRPAGLTALERVPDEVIEELERNLGQPLPPGYRRFLAQTNGAAPERPGVLRGFGFVADQRFLGLGRADPAAELTAANRYLADRFTADLLAIGYVQGGMIAVQVSGADADSVWYWDDDDPRAEEGQDAQYIRAHLLYRCADDIRQFWDRLATPAQALVDIAGELVAAGRVTRLAG